MMSSMRLLLSLFLLCCCVLTNFPVLQSFISFSLSCLSLFFFHLPYFFPFLLVHAWFLALSSLSFYLFSLCLSFPLFSFNILQPPSIGSTLIPTVRESIRCLFFLSTPLFSFVSFSSPFFFVAFLQHIATILHWINVDPDCQGVEILLSFSSFPSVPGRHLFVLAYSFILFARSILPRSSIGLTLTPTAKESKHCLKSPMILMDTG